MKETNLQMLSGNTLNSALILQKLVGFQSSWLLTFCKLYLAAFICSGFKNAVLKSNAKVQLCSEAHVRGIMAVIQNHLACVYTVQCLTR